MLWCLYCEYVCARHLSLLGFSINILKQSMMEVQFLKLFLKHIGRLFLISSFGGHKIRSENLKNITSNVLLNTLVTVDFGYLKKVSKKVKRHIKPQSH